MVIKGMQQKVVMKRLKPRVARSLEMGEIEIMLNQGVTKRAKGACAEYIGHMHVSPAEANTKVGFSEGLWLVSAAHLVARIGIPPEPSTMTP